MTAQITIQIDDKLYKIDEKFCECFMLHPSAGLILVNDLITCQCVSALLEKEGERFGISKTKILEHPSPCYDEDQFMEVFA